MLPLTGKEQKLLDPHARHPDARFHHFVIALAVEPGKGQGDERRYARLALYRRLRFGVQGFFDVVTVGAKDAD
jgi:hypothetical protein